MEEATLYVEKVKKEFGDNIQKYTDFQGIIKDLKYRKLDINKVIGRLCTIFKGNHELITGFNIFLPDGISVIIDSNNRLIVKCNKNLENVEDHATDLKSILKQKSAYAVTLTPVKQPTNTVRKYVLLDIPECSQTITSKHDQQNWRGECSTSSSAKLIKLPYVTYQKNCNNVPISMSVSDVLNHATYVKKDCTFLDLVGCRSMPDVLYENSRTEVETEISDVELIYDSSVQEDTLSNKVVIDENCSSVDVEGKKEGCGSWMPLFISEDSLCPLIKFNKKTLSNEDSCSGEVNVEKENKDSSIYSKEWAIKLLTPNTDDMYTPELLQYLDERIASSYLSQLELNTGKNVSSILNDNKFTGKEIGEHGSTIKNLSDEDSLEKNVDNFLNTGVSLESNISKWIMLDRYGCALCDYEAFTVEAIRKHWCLLHLSSKPYVCFYCNFEFSMTPDVYNHIKQHHPDSTVKYFIKTQETYIKQIKVNTDVFLPKVSENACLKVASKPTIRRTEFVKLYKLFNTFQEFIIVGTKVETTFSCVDCIFMTRSLSRLVHHSVIAHPKSGMQRALCRDKKCYWCKVAHNIESEHHKNSSNSSDKVCEMDNIAAFGLSAFRNGEPVSNTSVELNWRDAWQICIITEKVWFICKFCNCYSRNKSAIFQHIVINHNFPTQFKCAACMHKIKLHDENRSTGMLRCYECNATHALSHNLPDEHFETKHLNIIPNTDMTCKLCRFLSPRRSEVIIHLLNKHSPGEKYYKCPQCDFIHGIMTEVEVHLVNMHFHSNGRVIVKTIPQDYVTKGKDILMEETDVSGLRTSDVFNQKYTEGGGGYEVPIWKLWLSHLLEKKESQIRKIDTVTPLLPNAVKKPTVFKQTGRTKQKKGKNSDIIYRCCHCEFITCNWPAYLKHIDIKHGRRAKEMLKNKRKVFRAEHYQCLACFYRCIDRSCMSRHVKCMHLQMCAHWCPYCHYGNVEKTKVRNHVKTSHPTLPKKVKTDYTAMKAMTDVVNRYYVKVTKDGCKVQNVYKSAETQKDYKTQHGGNGAISEIENIKDETKMEATDDRYGQYPEIKKTEFMVLSVEHDKKTAIIATNSGVVNVNYKAYTPEQRCKVEVLDDSTDREHIEGINFEAFDINIHEESLEGHIWDDKQGPNRIIQKRNSEEDLNIKEENDSEDDSASQRKRIKLDNISKESVLYSSFKCNDFPQSEQSYEYLTKTEVNFSDASLSTNIIPSSSDSTIIYQSAVSSNDRPDMPQKWTHFVNGANDHYFTNGANDHSEIEKSRKSDTKNYFSLEPKIVSYQSCSLKTESNILWTLFGQPQQINSPSIDQILQSDPKLRASTIKVTDIMKQILQSS